MTTNTNHRVLMTGHHGYLGSVMAQHFVAHGYEVTGLDTGYFDDCTLIPDSGPVPTICKDIRDITPDDLRGFGAVVHLAALSNDPIGNLNDAWTEAINFDSSARLAQMARDAGVERFLFSSSCIMYGVAHAEVATEESPLNPQTAYARSKVQAEHAIRQLASSTFSPTFLRNGTVYGLSPRMRFDTVLNNLVGTAVATGRVTVLSDGTPWRPVIHIEDVARAFHTVLEAPRQSVHNQAINVGANHLNYRIRQLAELAAAAVPEATLEIVAKPDADQRTYRADFSKFANLFPTFEFKWTAERGAVQLADGFRAVQLKSRDFADKRFTRLTWLHHLIDSGRLDGSLRWRQAH